MRIKRSLLAGLMLLGCCLLSVSLAAQDYRRGYIIKNNNDSIRGLVRYKAGNNEFRCDFKQSKTSDRASFTPGELLGYGFVDGRRYVSVTLPGPTDANQKVFVRVLSEGPLTLYRYGKTFFVKKDELTELPVPQGKIVEHQETGGNRLPKFYEIKDKRYISILNVMMFDCQMNANDAPYYEPDLTSIVDKYNQCRGFPALGKKVKPLSRLNVGFFGGYVYSDLTIKEKAVVPFSISNVTLDPARTVIGGISLDLSSPRVYDKLFLTVEGWYFEGVYLGTDYRGSRKEDIIIDVNSMRMTVGFRYNFLSESSTPFVKLGFAGTITQDLTLKSIVEQESPLGEVFYFDDYVGTYFEKKIRGYWLGAGYDQLIIGRMKGFAEFRFERADAYFGTPNSPDSKLNNYSVLIGIRF